MVWLDPFVFCESLIHWSLTSIFPGKKRRKLLWRLAKRQLHQYTSFHPLQWWILVVCPSVRLRSLVWTLTLERLSMARRLPTQFPFIFSNGTINKNRRTNNKERKQGSCVCFMLLLTTTFSLESPDLRHHRKGKHYTMTSEILEWNSWQKFPPNCRTGCVDGVLQRQRPLGSDDFPGKGQVDQKMVQMCRYGWKVCC